MNNLYAHNPSERVAALVKLLLSAGFLAASGLASAEDLPAFRQGLWEFNRSIDGASAPADRKKLTVRKCVDPREDMKTQNAMLAKAGCKFSPMKQMGNTYRFSADCTIQGAGRSTSRSVMTVDSDSAYTVKVESEGTKGGKTVRTSEVLSAKRLGDCAKP